MRRPSAEHRLPSPDLRDQLQHALGSTYTLERELGGGGMSRVFVAKELALGRLVVIKVLPPETAAQLSIERFKREISLASQLQQAHIVPLLSAGEVHPEGSAGPGLPYYTMPFVEGESLRARLAREGELPIGEAVGLLKEVARALAYAHQHGVVHRDIKPDNVLLSGGSAMVTDFGVAKALSASTSPGSGGLTSLGIALGTPAYMAPEQASADPLVDHRADIYAWGVMAYELLTGQPPFAGRPPQAMLAAAVSEVPELVTKRRSAVPPALAALVMRCLEKRAADRVQSAAEIVQALDAIVTPAGGMLPASGATDPSRRIWTRTVAAAAAAVLMVILGASAFAYKRGKAHRASLPKSIAVLPIENLSGAQNDEFFNAGITEEITDALGKVPGLSVAARTSAAAAAAKGRDVRRIGQELRVTWVLQSGIQRLGDRVRINVQLIDAGSGFEQWSGRYDDKLKDIFQVQDKIAKAIAANLQIKLAGGVTSPIVRASTENPEAHALYLQGLYLWNRRTGKTMRQALSFFEQAIAKDSGYARAYAWAATAYQLLPLYADIPQADARAKADWYARRAIELDSTIAEAYSVLAGGEENLYHNASSERLYRRAIALDSALAPVHAWYAGLLARVGRHDEALREVRRAQALEPQSLVIVTSVGGELIGSRRFAEAESTLRKVIEIEPAFSLAYQILGEVHLARGQNDSAIVALKRNIELLGDRRSFNVALLARAYAISGRTTEARALLQELLARSQREPVSGGGMALIYDALGDSEHAIKWLSRAVASHDAQGIELRSFSPIFDHLRADPRGAALFARIEAMNDSPERRE